MTMPSPDGWQNGGTGRASNNVAIRLYYTSNNDINGAGRSVEAGVTGGMAYDETAKTSTRNDGGGDGKHHRLSA